ncbi:MAG: hypothetical protein H5T33_05935 [Candidatus Methanosuratus sp.]|nr:hypothetical protein [Candidatus Methanosuratincola sp.]
MRDGELAREKKQVKAKKHALEVLGSTIEELDRRLWPREIAFYLIKPASSLFE